VDGVYMPAHGTAHEEVVLQQSGVVKLEVIERGELQWSVKQTRTERLKQRRKETKKKRRRNKEGKIGKKINFDA
jgi:hypothetical protein